MLFSQDKKHLPTRRISPLSHVHLIQTPTPFDEVSTVNSYVIEDPLTVVDCGVDLPNAWEAFVLGLRKLGHEPQEVERMVLTHAHPDHMGFAKRLQEISGATVYVGEKEAHAFRPEGLERMQKRGAVYQKFLGRLGLEESLISLLMALYGQMKSIAPPLLEFETLADGDTLEFFHGPLEVLHTPGHTYGLICLHDLTHGVLLSSDHLLQEVSPNPVLDLGPEGEKDFDKKFRSLTSYYEQIHRVGAMSFNAILPGHGDPFIGHKQVIETLMGFYDERQATMWEILKNQGPQNVSSLGKRLFPHVKRKKSFMVACEVLGNLEVLEDRGLVARELDGEVYVYHAVGDHAVGDPHLGDID